MTPLPPKAHICSAIGDVRFVPIADKNYACGAGSAEDGFWPSPIVSAVSPAMLPSCMLSTAVLGTMTIVEFCFSPSYSMFIARKWNAFGLLA